MHKVHISRDPIIHTKLIMLPLPFVDPKRSILEQPYLVSNVN